MSKFNDTAPKMGKFGQNREFLKIPRFEGFWDFPREQNKIPTGSSNSLDLGKIPRSGHTVEEVEFVFQRKSAQVYTC